MTAELTRLQALLRPLCREGIALAFSGGVDSTLLLAVLAQLRKEAPFPLLALTAGTDLLEVKELENVRALAASYAVPHEVLRCDVFQIPEVRHNDPRRCYFCKKALFSAMLRRAREKGIAVLAEGSHADDLKSYRPGRQALAELGVLSPLLQAGLGKPEIRALARELGIAVAEKPAAPCLATRFDYGTLLTEEKLKQAAAGEAFLRSVLDSGIDLRLRVHGTLARIEVPPALFPAVTARSGEIVKKLRELGFERVTLDLAGFRSGGFDDRFTEKGAEKNV